MSVIVRGMGMPKDCFECMVDCPVGTQRFIVTGRPRGCPLVEIPTPHGRLIDVDELNIHDISPVYGFCVMGVTEEDIELVDTVIEAEEET